jgi:pimeloyl-ACP methyl ester carboxylesterase
MGGMVSLALAIRHPSRVRGAVLVNPAGMARLPAWARLGGRLVLRRSLLDRLLPKVWKNGILSNVFYEKNDYTRAFIAMIEASFGHPSADQLILDVAALMHELRAELLERDYAHFLGSIDRPIGVVWGEKDRLVPARLLHDAARKLPNVLLDEIPRCGHMPNIEQPERVTRFIQILLDRTSTVSPFAVR